LRIDYEKPEIEKSQINDSDSDKILEKANSTEVTIENKYESVIKNEKNQVDDNATLSNAPLESDVDDNTELDDNCDIENAMFVSELEAEKIASSYMVFQVGFYVLFLFN
jgi:hypothetical protein